MITEKIIIEKGFPHVWSIGSLTMFYQTKEIISKTPHHILYDTENGGWFFRGRGHTISEFKSINELDKLIDIYIRKYEN